MIPRRCSATKRLLLPLAVHACASRPAAKARARRGARRSQAGRPRRRVVPACRRRTTSATWTAASRSRREEVKGRNMWLVWSGGNDRFWTQMTDYTFGAFDLLKVVSSHPSLGYSRANRWNYFGLVNEPCFEAATGPDKYRRGLWLDVRSKDCAPDPFENESKYPGVDDRLARQAAGRRHDAAGGLLLRLGHRHRRPAPVSQPGLRREGRQGMGRGEVLHRPELLQPQGPGAARTAWACPAASATSARAR